MAAQRAFVEPWEYLRWEAKAEEKHEYVHGVVYAMAGASRNHGEICASVLVYLGRMLEGSACRPLGPDIKVWIEEASAFYYPDLTISCPPNFTSDSNGVIDNPTVVIEVVSPSTANIDRGPKFVDYQTLPLLKEYVLIDSDRMRVELFTQDGGTWVVRTYECDDQHVPLDSIGVVLPISAIYRHVEFR